ncbi:MAG TPA: NFACT RNA binding domain-containing protein [Clostridia bacterium]|nr:NFACT RNA binding domain-containing protein [Clostridia bacterium]
MPYDGLVLSAATHELRQNLIGGRVERVHQPEKEKIIIAIYNNRKRYRLLLSAHAANARIHLTEAQYKNPPSPPLFCMVLRKHLEGGRIKSFEQPRLERVLKITVSASDELGRDREKILICEIMGRHSNLIIVDPMDKTIIDGIKRYTHAVSRHREVYPGIPYISPPRQDKLNPLLMDEESFRDACLAQPWNKKLPDVLFAVLEGFSPLTCKELVYRTGLDLRFPLESCGDYELRILWESVQGVVGPARQGEFQTTLVTDSDNTPLEFAALDLTHYPTPEENVTRHRAEISTILDKFFHHKETSNQIQQIKQNFSQLLNTHMKRLKKKFREQKKDFTKAEDAEKYREWGELVFANLHWLKAEKGKQEIALDSLYAPGEEVVIHLDPSLEPVRNAEKFFKRYRKAKTTRKILGKRTAQTKQELDYLQSVEIATLESTTLDELEEVKQELADGGYLKKEKRKAKKRLGIPTPASYVSSDGFTVLLGKNNRQNDYLTLKMAGAEDIWLHTKDIPGAHVIIRRGSRGVEIPERTLVEAAQLAAYNSKAKLSQNVPVDYTRKKFVTKPKGAKPGMVIYRYHKTLTVNPKESLRGDM